MIRKACIRRIHSLISSGLPGVPCPCCPPPTTPTPTLLPGFPAPTGGVDATKESTGEAKSDQKSPNSTLPEEDNKGLFASSVSELRRKAQEHSAALWQLAQTVQQQQQQQKQDAGEEKKKEAADDDGGDDDDLSSDEAIEAVTEGDDDVDVAAASSP